MGLPSDLMLNGLQFLSKISLMSGIVKYLFKVLKLVNSLWTYVLDSACCNEKATFLMGLWTWN